MRNKTNFRIIVLGLILCSSAFAKTYEYVGFYQLDDQKDSFILNNKSVSPVKLMIEKDKRLEVYDNSYIRLVLEYPKNCKVTQQKCIGKVKEFKGLLSGLEKVPNYLVK